ncbi:flagellin [Halorubrum salipaludis]|uniref:Flagellin n=1 Tax=Halorubrum salipaludis TaxID=2032630 RepID=A0A2A2FF63_9EURY|nr:archaellin/type IV pilin N-terminal domain-containing protein [Halorubrum salipaludis]PAU83608.1 flagellin [Halorubrum salipaludis]
MFEFATDDERGQVGIGTLIVFIAMVLVAAIAAGVLINTAGFLQTQAEATGEESTSQVSDRVQIVSQSGNVTDSQEVDKLQIILAKAPGAGNIDLNETSVELIGSGGQETFSVGDEGNASIDMFAGTSDAVLIDNSDRAELEITLSTDIDYPVLQPGDRLSVTFTTASGATTTTEIRVPTTLTDEQSSVRL